MSKKEVITCDICHKQINPPIQYCEVHNIKIRRPKSIKVLFGFTDGNYDKIWVDESDICEECNSALLKKWDEVVKERRNKL